MDKIEHKEWRSTWWLRMLGCNSVWCGKPKKTGRGSWGIYDGGWKPNQDAFDPPRVAMNHVCHCHAVTYGTNDSDSEPRTVEKGQVGQQGPDSTKQPYRAFYKVQLQAYHSCHPCRIWYMAWRSFYKSYTELLDPR